MAADLYKIGAVAKRTGITPECLRAWERRYGLQPADKAGNTRFYSAEQVSWLTMVKAALDQGHPISQVIRLDVAELRQRLQPAQARTQPRAGRVGVVGGALLQAYRSATDKRIALAAEWASFSELDEQQDALPTLDLLFLYLPSLDPKRIESAREFYPETKIAVAFKYATAADLEEVQSMGYALLRWPSDWAAVERVVAAHARFATLSDTARLYSDGELLHIDTMASQAACECPRHLAALIGGLNDYATHAARCDGDEDHAAILGDLYSARAQLERSLKELVEKHGLLATAN